MSADIKEIGGATQLSGRVNMKVIRGVHPIPPRQMTMKDVVKFGFPQDGLTKEVNDWRQSNVIHLQRGLRRVAAVRAMAKLVTFPHLEGILFGQIIRADGGIVDLGLMSMQVVTTAGVNFIVDAFQNTTEVENFKFHGIGTGTNSEAVGDTALQTELTTQYNPDNTRATGSQTENGANVYRTVGTNTVDSAVAITEHGILTQAATGGGTLLDRSVFSAVNLANGDSLQTTYDLTVSSGG